MEKTRKAEGLRVLERYADKAKKFINEKPHVAGPITSFAVQATTLAAFGRGDYEPGFYLAAVNGQFAVKGVIDSWNYARKLKAQGNIDAAWAARFASAGYAINAIASAVPFVEHLFTRNNADLTYYGIALPIIGGAVLVSDSQKYRARRLELEKKFEDGNANLKEMEELKCIFLNLYSKLSKKLGYVQNPKLQEFMKGIARIEKAIESSAVSS